MLRKILKWTGIFIVCLVAGVSVATMARQHLTYNAPYPNIKATADVAVIERGKEITMVTRGCVHCHSPEEDVNSLLQKGEEPSLEGAKRVETPFGIFFIPNITPDAKTGIGSMTDAEIARVLRYGIKKNGEAVLPFMQGQDMSDEDMTAVISYLRSIKPVQNKVPENEFNLVGRFAKAFVLKPSIPQDTRAVASK
ncbi:c-type cytochrome [Pontibacter chitinilyticus]|uniref:c-type cytochrome n=1 Tax=Pontibacter chitinilyticus TaxID=2674989 RepID=UPI00321A214B